MFSHGLVVFCEIFTACGVFAILLKRLPVPFFDHNGTTLMLAGEYEQLVWAHCLGQIIGNPTATLDTWLINRILFKDGTSLDWLKNEPDFKPMYRIVALKTVALGLFSLKDPMEEAVKLKLEMMEDGIGVDVQIVDRPDTEFPAKSVVIILATPFIQGLCGDGVTKYGCGILIRKHALRVGGRRPKLGSPL